jgi:NAD(P)-dependent dehydrogenase (short-subunit alcohol dehydrogenase family)
MVAKTVARYGRLDGAVNNAGIAGAPFHAIADIPDENWHAVINTNLNAVFMSMKFEIPAMLKSGGGAIVNMSSMLGLIGSDIGHGAYCASKFAVVGLTKTAAIDYGQKGIRVNALCPGYCHSEMVDPYVDAEPALFEKLLKRHSAMNRLGESDEVAEAIAFLLSDSSSFINGVAIPMQGGEMTRLF